MPKKIAAVKSHRLERLVRPQARQATSETTTAKVGCEWLEVQRRVP